jgi:hypothetical protein
MFASPREKAKGLVLFCVIDSLYLSRLFLAVSVWRMSDFLIPTTLDR